MEFLGFLAGAVLALLVALALFRTIDPQRRRPRRAPVDPPPEREGDRVETLCQALSGDPVRDRPLLNRLLALGPGIIPTLLEVLAQQSRQTDGAPVRRVARLEELVADFGLAAVPPVTDVLARLQPTAPLAPALTRILHRLGQAGARSVLMRGLKHPELAPFLPRFRHLQRGDPSTALFLTLRDHRADPGPALATLAGLLVDRPDVIDRLWQAWDGHARVALLDFLCDWLPLARPTDVSRGLADAAPATRAAAARLAHLMIDPTLVGPLSELALTDHDPTSRAAAVRALAVQPSVGARPALLEVVADPDPAVALLALVGIILGHPPVAERARLAAGALGDGAAARLCAAQAPLTGLAQGPLDPLLAALEDPAPGLRALAAALVGRHLDHDPRARERLIRIADGSAPGDAVLAVSALARAQDPTAPELLAKLLRLAPSPADLLLLQEAAQHIGEPAVLPLARRLRPGPPGRVEATLAVLRAQPYAAAVPPLLRGLEDARSGHLEGLLGATLHAGGAAVWATIDEALRQPRRGLLPPALRFLAAYADDAHVPLLLELFDRHPPLRSVILNLIEAHGEAARAALGVRIAEGGEDAMLAGMEQRKALLDACAEVE